MEKIVTEQEWELIDTIRNYKKTYPKSLQLEFYVLNLFENLLYE
ncbi:MAG: hypothetical protein ACPGTO_03350 [Polaribacter sp.]